MASTALYFPPIRRTEYTHHRPKLERQFDPSRRHQTQLRPGHEQCQTDAADAAEYHDRGQHRCLLFQSGEHAKHSSRLRGRLHHRHDGFNTVAFVQMRFVGTSNAAAYEAISAAGTKTQVIVPLYMKRLGNGFATAVTIQNLGAQAATVNISYKQGDDAPSPCTVDLTRLNIPVGGSLIQYHRLANGPNSVPSLPEICFGSMIVKSTNGQPIEAKVLQ
jgi:hypothetical protein